MTQNVRRWYSTGLVLSSSHRQDDLQVSPIDDIPDRLVFRVRWTAVRKPFHFIGLQILWPYWHTMCSFSSATESINTKQKKELSMRRFLIVAAMLAGLGFSASPSMAYAPVRRVVAGRVVPRVAVGAGVGRRYPVYRPYRFAPRVGVGVGVGVY